MRALSAALCEARKPGVESEFAPALQAVVDSPAVEHQGEEGVLGEKAPKTQQAPARLKKTVAPDAGFTVVPDPHAQPFCPLFPINLALLRTASPDTDSASPSGQSSSHGVSAGPADLKTQALNCSGPVTLAPEIGRPEAAEATLEAPESAAIEQLVEGAEPRGPHAGGPRLRESQNLNLSVALRVKSTSTVARSPQSGQPSHVPPVRVAPVDEAQKLNAEDLQQAVGMRTPAVRAAVWSVPEPIAPALAKDAHQDTNEVRPLSEPTVTKAEGSTTERPQPLKDLSVEIRQPNQEKVAVRLVERSGELHVAVHATDGAVAHSLREGLPELVNRLDETGFRAEGWRPVGVVTATGPAVEARRSSAEFGHDASQSGQSWSQQSGSKQERHQPDRPRWVQELEGTLAGGEESTGEFHGVSR